MRLPITFPRDAGTAHIHLNGDILPSSPFAAVIAAVQFLQPEYKWSDLDILTDRNCLRKLLRWIGNSHENRAKDFRIDLELAGSKSVILNRWEEKTTVDV